MIFDTRAPTLLDRSFSTSYQVLHLFENILAEFKHSMGLDTLTVDPFDDLKHSLERTMFHDPLFSEPVHFNSFNSQHGTLMTG